MNPTETKSQALERLFTENGLLPEDWFNHSQYRIITRSGIEKIQGKNKIEVRFDAVTMTPQFCVVKATATKEGARIETFGSAGFQADGAFPKGKQFQYLYLPEMAEKRALSRAVLKTMGFYELGVFGEDEADDFKQSSPAAPATELASRAQKQELLVLMDAGPMNPATATTWRETMHTATATQLQARISRLREHRRAESADYDSPESEYEATGHGM